MKTSEIQAGKKYGRFGTTGKLHTRTVISTEHLLLVYQNCQGYTSTMNRSSFARWAEKEVS